MYALQCNHQTVLVLFSYFHVDGDVSDRLQLSGRSDLTYQRAQQYVVDFCRIQTQFRHIRQILIFTTVCIPYKGFL